MAQDQPLMTPERMEQGRKYRATQYRLQLGRTLLSAGFMLLMVLGGAAWLWSITAAPLPFVVGLITLSALVELPLDYYGYQLARRYGISIQGLGSWLGDQIKSFMISLLLMGILFFWILRLWQFRPETWHIHTGAVTLLVALFMVFLAPVLIAPLFHKYRPLGDGELKDRLMALSKRAGVWVQGCFVMEASKKSTGLNASLSGMGKTRRITLYDTLIEACTPKEVEVVLAHEMGHHIHNHILKFTALYSLAIIGIFWAGGAWLAPLSEALGLGGLTPAALPLGILLVSLSSLTFRPLLMAVSRHFERECDTFALKMTDDPDSFISAFRKLADRNLADFSPPRWAYYLFYSHPPIPERVAMAERYRARG